MSSAATEGSTLRTASPPPPPIAASASAGSDSGGSQSGMGAYPGSQLELARAQSLSVSNTQEAHDSTSASNVTVTVAQTDAEAEEAQQLHDLRISFLDHFSRGLSQLQNVGGVRSIPYIQVILTLISDLQPDNDLDLASLEKLIVVIVFQIDFDVRTW